MVKLPASPKHYRFTIRGYISRDYAESFALACEVRGPLMYEYDPRSGGMTTFLLSDGGVEPQYDLLTTLREWKPEQADLNTLNLDIS